MKPTEYDKKEYRKYTGKREKQTAILELQGIVSGIAIDREISQAEKREVDHWLQSRVAILGPKLGGEIRKFLGNILADNRITEEERADLDYYFARWKTESPLLTPETQALIQLQGLLHGILADNRILEGEARGLREWLSRHEYLAGAYPYDEIYSLLVGVLGDGVIDTEEERILKAFFGDFLPSETLVDRVAIQEAQEHTLIRGICAVDPEIEFEGRIFCPTGVFTGKERKEVFEILRGRGARPIDSVSSNTDYLVVGSEGNQSWMYSCYGRKVEKAMEIRRNGGKVVIVHEVDFWDALG